MYMCSTVRLMTRIRKLFTKMLCLNQLLINLFLFISANQNRASSCD